MMFTKYQYYPCPKINYFENKRLEKEGKNLILDIDNDFWNCLLNKNDFVESEKIINYYISITQKLDEPLFEIYAKYYRLHLWIYYLGYINKSFTSALELLNIVSQKNYDSVLVNFIYSDFIYCFIQKDCKNYYSKIDYLIKNSKYHLFNGYLGYFYLNIGKIIDFKSIFKEKIKNITRKFEYEANTLDNNFIMYQYYYGLGICYLKQKKFSKALENFEMSGNFKVKIIYENHYLGKAELFLNIGQINRARFYTEKALKISKQKNFNFNISKAYNLLYNIEKQKSNSNKEMILEYALKSYNIIKGFGFDKFEINALNNIIKQKKIMKINFKDEYEKVILLKKNTCLFDFEELLLKIDFDKHLVKNYY